MLQALSGRPVAEICGEHDIGEAEFARWRVAFFEEHARPLSAALAAGPVSGGELPALFSVPGKREEALRVAQEMIEILPVPVFFKGRDGKYLGVNQAWESFFGVPRASFVGKEVHDLYPQSPAVADKHYAMDQELWQNPGSQSYEIPVVTRDGGTRHTIYYKATFKGPGGEVAGLIGTIIDITGRKQAEQSQAIEYAVTRLLAQAHTIEEVMPTVIRTLCEGLGYAYGARWVHEPREHVLRSVESWCESAPEVEEFRRMSTERVETRPEMPGGLNRRVWITGEPVWMPEIAREKALARRDDALRAGLHSAFAFPILVGGEFYGVMEFFSRAVMARDQRVLEIAQTAGIQIGQFIARLQAESALHEANDELERQAQELMRSNAELQQFAYVASHDLQEPLRMISSYTQLLQRRYGERFEPEAKEFMEFVVDGATRMKQLIEDILAYSRIGTRSREFKTMQCDAALAKALVNLRGSIEAKNATVTSDPLPAVRGDEVQLVQLFQNLIGNALKFKGDGPPRVHVSAAERPDAWEIAVRDNGIGIDLQYFERIFMVFQRLHSKGEYPGTGIGLAICKKVVDRHGGRIRVESGSGEGCTFYFTLPRRGGSHAGQG
ncbi:MAG TPA: ATP-binding protein [Burkholderiales bacterium]|nr:ATP-binding protein [Burkholderiales bacterium]